MPMPSSGPAQGLPFRIVDRFPRLAAAAVVALAAAAVGCRKKPVTFATEVELTRIDVVQRNQAGAPDLLDVEFTWTACGQRETIRGSRAFAACLAPHPVGARVPAKVLWHWDDAGFYDWDVTEMGGCARPPEDGDAASFDTVQECTPLKEHGAVIGFRCNRIAEKELLAKCPWFARR